MNGKTQQILAVLKLSSHTARRTYIKNFEFGLVQILIKDVNGNSV
jgi:hypothetical protein